MKFLRFKVSNFISITNRSFSVNYPNLQQEAAINDDDLDILYKRVLVEVRGHERAVLDSYTEFIQSTADGLDLKENFVAIHSPERFIERWSLLKSKFVHKKHFRQYEMRTHIKQYEFKHLTGSTCSTLLEYIQRNIPDGVSMYVFKTKIECLPENLTKQPIL